MTSAGTGAARLSCSRRPPSHTTPTEELDRLAPEEIIGGYYRQVGVVWDGGRSLETL